MPVNRQRLLILGSGFASFSLLKAIDTSVWHVVLVSPRNHFLFTPLLPSTTVGTLEFRSIIEPIRQSREGIEYVEATAVSLDTSAKIAECVAEGVRFTLPYDVLAIGVGADVNTFGIPGVREYALTLKELGDAREIRQRILRQFERASRPGMDADERRRHVHCVVVGGGPTGVEFAAEMADFLSHDLRKFYPGLLPDVRITLLEAGSSILNTFDAVLSGYTMNLFRRQRIDVRIDSPVVSISEREIVLKDGTRLPYGMVVWSTGVGPRDFTRTVTLPKDSHMRLLVNSTLLVKGESDIYALGDCAVVEGADLPMTAQVAQQQGKYLAESLSRRILNKKLKPFQYQGYGMLAYIGRNRALADLEKVKGRGFMTFLFWRSVYLTRLVSIRNKLLVVLDWLKTSVFGRDISRF